MVSELIPERKEKQFFERIQNKFQVADCNIRELVSTISENKYQMTNNKLR